MSCWEIRIEGIVQGVGFRPHVYQLAQKEGIKGTVSNGVAGVCIEFAASPEKAQFFYQKILDERPRISKVTHHQIQPISPKFFDEFQIIESESSHIKRIPF
ncbi:MAG: acylphosphatase, partial [Bacteroidota bacterium]